MAQAYLACFPAPTNLHVAGRTDGDFILPVQMSEVRTVAVPEDLREVPFVIQVAATRLKAKAPTGKSSTEHLFEKTLDLNETQEA